MRARTFALVLSLASTLFAGCAAETVTAPAPVAASSGDALVARPYFEVWQTSGRHYFHFAAANHEITLSSESYTTRTAALGGVLSVLDNGQIRARYVTRQATNGQWYFVLRASNGATIATSETYVTKSNAERGIDGVIASCAQYEEWLANRTGARFETFRGTDGRWYFDLHAGNGEIVLASQGYTSESAALNGTFAVADVGTSVSKYDVRQATNGQWYFNVIGANGAVVGTSETYTTRTDAERGRDAIITMLPGVELL